MCVRACVHKPVNRRYKRYKCHNVQRKTPRTCGSRHIDAVPYFILDLLNKRYTHLLCAPKIPVVVRKLSLLPVYRIFEAKYGTNGTSYPQCATKSVDKGPLSEPPHLDRVLHTHSQNTEHEGRCALMFSQTARDARSGAWLGSGATAPSSPIPGNLQQHICLAPAQPGPVTHIFERKKHHEQR